MLIVSQLCQFSTFGVCIRFVSSPVACGVDMRPADLQLKQHPESPRMSVILTVTHN